MLRSELMYPSNDGGSIEVSNVEASRAEYELDPAAVYEEFYANYGAGQFKDGDRDLSRILVNRVFHTDSRDGSSSRDMHLIVRSNPGYRQMWQHNNSSGTIRHYGEGDFLVASTNGKDIVEWTVGAVIGKNPQHNKGYGHNSETFVIDLVDGKTRAELILAPGCDTGTFETLGSNGNKFWMLGGEESKEIRRSILKNLDEAQARSIGAAALSSGS